MLMTDSSRALHRADYQRVLIDEAEKLGARIQLDADVVDVDFENTSLTLRNGDIISADVVIGADGMHPTFFTNLLLT